MIADRRREMVLKKRRPYMRVSQVRIKNSAYSWPEGSMVINQFYASSTTVKIYYKSHIYNNISCQLGTRLVNGDGGPDLYVAHWMKSGGGTLTHQARNADDTLIYQYVKTTYRATSQETTFGWESSNYPDINTNLSIKYNDGFVNGSSSAYNTFRNGYNNVPIQKLILQGGPNTEGDGRTVYIDEIKVLINDVPVVYLIPVYFTDTNEYGLMDTVSGNYMDKNNFADGTIIFEG